jgi:hypothetical protein
MELIPINTNTATSADFTLFDGQSTTIFLKDATSNEVTADALALVQIKAGEAYFTIGKLDVASPGRVLQAPGTFRVLKFNSPVAFGVERI